MDESRDPLRRELSDLRLRFTGVKIDRNFGPFALPLVGIVLGYWLYALNSLVFRYFSGPVGIALLAWLMIHYQMLAVTSFSVFVFDIALIVVVSLALLIKWFRRL